ncbi:hypothetical protein D3C76_1095310 [compost metagenome]
MGAGNTGADVDRQTYCQAPDQADLPQTEVGATDHEGGDAASAEEDEKSCSDEFGQALAEE